MKQMIEFFASYALAGAFILVFFAVLIKFGAREDSIVKFAEEHRGMICFVQAYMACRITEM